MGYMRHHAIVVTSWNREHLEAAFVEAARLFAGTEAKVSPPTAQGSNGYRSFFVAPDGSKEGWNESDAADLARDKLVAFLREGKTAGRLWAAWVEVQFGDEDRETKVCRDSDHDDDGDSVAEDDGEHVPAAAAPPPGRRDG